MAGLHPALPLPPPLTPPLPLPPPPPLPSPPVCATGLHLLTVCRMQETDGEGEKAGWLSSRKRLSQEVLQGRRPASDPLEKCSKWSVKLKGLLESEASGPFGLGWVGFQPRVHRTGSFHHPWFMTGCHAVHPWPDFIYVVAYLMVNFNLIFNNTTRTSKPTTCVKSQDLVNILNLTSKCSRPTPFPPLQPPTRPPPSREPTSFLPYARLLPSPPRLSSACLLFYVL